MFELAIQMGGNTDGGYDEKWNAEIQLTQRRAALPIEVGVWAATNNHYWMGGCKQHCKHANY
jgi:hypothetical protein